MGRGFLPMSTAPSALRAERLYRLAFGLGLLIAATCFVAGLAQVAVSEHRLPGLEMDPLIHARDALAHGENAAAAREYRGLAAVNSRDFDLLLQAAEGLVRAGDAAGGAELIGRAWSMNPGHPRVQTTLGWALYWTKKYDEAASRFESALRADPREVRAHAGLAEVRLEQKRYAEAEASLLRALEIDPTVGSAHNSLGVAYALTGRPERAVEEFGIAARLSPAPDILANLERARGGAAGKQP
jgi:tetratricopeptide (TPR) repeat protein